MDWKIVNSVWRGIMDERVNPLKRLPRASAHLIMLALSWMWSAIFSLALGSFLLFGALALAHTLILVGTFVTLVAFEAVSRARAQNRARKKLNQIWSTTSPV